VEARVIPILFVLATLFHAHCDLEHPSGQGACTRRAVDAVGMNQLQAIGTHNSYKQAISAPEMAAITAQRPDMARGLDYSHLPLDQELDAGARQLELDIVNDPQGGRYADPLGPRLVPGAPPYDSAVMRQPGMKVMHMQDIDYRSSCALFTQCLRTIRAWSLAHRDHVPILILLNLKEGGALPLPGAVSALPFDPPAMDAIDREIRSVFPERELITPDQVQGRHASLREAVLAGAWPRLGAARGRVIFALDAPPDQVARYRGQRHSLEGRVMFVNTDEASPAAGYITLNDPLHQAERIRRDVAQGFLVRTRADADTEQSRRNDTSMREAALGSGAQYVSTDYMRPDLRFSSYSVAMPGGLRARVSPAVGEQAPEG
jgi:hypothetical protein